MSEYLVDVPRNNPITGDTEVVGLKVDAARAEVSNDVLEFWTDEELVAAFSRGYWMDFIKQAEEE